MKVYELIELLKKQPQLSDVLIDDGKYVNQISEVEHDDRDYVIIRPL